MSISLLLGILNTRLKIDLAHRIPKSPKFEILET
jgi:hypothetical protein